MAKAKPVTRKRRSEALEPPKSTKPAAKKRKTVASNQQLINNKTPTTRLDVYVFGEGSAGELGLGSQNATDVARPRLNVKLDAGKVGVVNVAAGGMHAVALTHDGKILTWGVNDNNALGRETSWEGGVRDIDNDAASDDSDGDLNPYESTPTAITMSETNFVGVTAGDSASFALTQQGHVYGWGTFVSNEAKKGFLLDQNRLIETQNKPILIPGLERIIQISAGNNFCLALNADGKVYSWGMSEQNQLGRRLTVDRRSSARASEAQLAKMYLDIGLVPGLVAFSSRTKIRSIHAGSDHAFAIDHKGDTWAWGLNNFGQTGIKGGAGANGSTIVAARKVPSLVGKKMKMIQGGTHHSIGVTEMGACLVWGRMDGAQTGIDVSTLPIDDPKTVISERDKPRILLEPTALPIQGASYVAAGSDHNILITAEGKAYSWGFNANYQCGQGPGGDDIAVATLIDNSAVRHKQLSWAGAGGQYSMVAGPHKPPTDSTH